MGLIKSVAAPAVTTIIAGYMLKQVIDKIKNDARKKRIIEDLSLNDPLLKEVDKQTLLQWYATMCYYAPTLANDKLTVTEILHTFARFGKIDFNTIKLLVDTEKATAETAKAHSDTLKGVVGLVSPWK